MILEVITWRTTANLQRTAIYYEVRTQDHFGIPETEISRDRLFDVWGPQIRAVALKQPVFLAICLPSTV